ncbi:MAG: hypothetical protein GY749_06910 [Desulfobacteraceae bacterium]|nr:hypothetical protein [Desulfobacteraceae bacterium]
MKHAIILAAVLAMAVSVVYAQQETSVPPLINYQGMLADANGNPMIGTKKLTFNIYDAAIGGNLVWGPQVFDSVPLINGRFNVILGTTDNNGKLIIDAFDAKERYLGITVDSNSEISPRQQILSAPYAIQAVNAETIKGTKAQLDANGIFIRKITRATGNGPETGAGLITGRVLKFNKIRDDTAIRIGYTDNTRVMNGAGRLEIIVDGVSCPGGALIYDYAMLNSPNSNHHGSQQVVGYCQGITSGEHEIQIRTGTVSEYPVGDIDIGYKYSTWVIEVEEVY